MEKDQHKIIDIFFNKHSSVSCDTENSSEILKAFNDVIHGLYFLDEQSYILETLNVATYVEKEYKKLMVDIGLDLPEMADKFEMIRSLLFGDSFNWDAIHQELTARKEL